MRTRWLIALLCLLSMDGCATSTQWTKPGVTQEELARDREACRREASRTAFSGKKRWTLIHSPDFYHECLEGKGYVKARSS